MHRDEKLSGLVRAGVTLVVNLMEAEETNYQGQAFVDYAARFLELSATEGRAVRVERFAIRDQSVPGVDQMKVILTAIAAEIKSGGTVFVHCWGGKGRTATVVGCYLRQYQGEPTEAVLQKLRDLTAHASESFWPTPQTEEQCQFIRDWNHDRI
jgi:protein tyrosine/serine phosphatase